MARDKDRVVFMEATIDDLLCSIVLTIAGLAIVALILCVLYVFISLSFVTTDWIWDTSKDSYEDGRGVFYFIATILTFIWLGVSGHCWYDSLFVRSSSSRRPSGDSGIY